MEREAAVPGQLVTPEMQAQPVLSTSVAWNGQVYDKHLLGKPVFSILKVSMSPSSISAWHRHSMILVGLVLHGSLTLETADGASRTFVKGDGIAETVGTIHRAHSGQQGAELAVFALGDPSEGLTEIVDSSELP